MDFYNHIAATKDYNSGLTINKTVLSDSGLH